MPRSVAEIEADIARVKQEIAARNTYKQPQTRVGWGSYIVDGDRGMLDAYQNRENQYNQMLQQQAFQSAERALQQKFQEQENERNRQNARILADEQRKENALYQMDENMKSRANAVTKQQYAQYELARARRSKVKDDIKQAEMNLALANNELEYWNKRTGYAEPKKEGSDNKEDVPPKTDNTNDVDNREANKSTPVKLIDSQKIKRFNTKKARQEHADKLRALDPDGQDEKIQEEINRIESLDTDEDKSARKKAWETGKKLKGYDYRKWKDSKEGKKLIAEFGE